MLFYSRILPIKKKITISYVEQKENEDYWDMMPSGGVNFVSTLCLYSVVVIVLLNQTKLLLLLYTRLNLKTVVTNMVATKLVHC